jgi:hypothetical protein
MTFVLDYGNGKWCLEPKTDHNGTYYEVYAHSDDDTFGKYVGDFECNEAFETREFIELFDMWIKEN